MNRLIIMFQSTPHLSGKANNFFQQHGAYSFLVSIHASPQRQGERHHFPARLLAEGFNPRLTSAARRTFTLFGGRFTASCFNPRLTSAARRTSRAGITGSQEGVSIHASPQRQGEQISFKFLSKTFDVSIHASPQRQGEPQREALKVVDKSFNPRLTSAARRTLSPVVRPSGREFQSTPHLSGKANAGRGCGLTFVLGFNPRLTSAARRTQSAEVEALPPEVSIHASPQRQGEHRNIVRLLQVKLVSIHASPQRQGEHILKTFKDGQIFVSIHASPQRQGELVILLLFEVCKFVSIHASPQRQGERACSYASVRI